jgi:hypothetical protein
VTPHENISRSFRKINPVINNMRVSIPSQVGYISQFRGQQRAAGHSIYFKSKWLCIVNYYRCGLDLSIRNRSQAWELFLYYTIPGSGIHGTAFHRMPEFPSSSCKTISTPVFPSPLSQIRRPMTTPRTISCLTFHPVLHACPLWSARHMALSVLFCLVAVN